MTRGQHLAAQRARQLQLARRARALKAYPRLRECKGGVRSRSAQERDMRDFNHLAAVRPLAARLADRDRRCFVCANGPPEPGFFLWLVDDGGALEIVERVDDPKVAEWLAQLVNEAIAAERGKREARP